MDVSFNIIVDLLRPMLSENYSFSSSDKTFDQIMLLPDESSPVNRNHLYYTDTNSFRESVYRNEPGLYVIFIDDGGLDYSGFSCHPIPLAAGNKHPDVLNTLLSVFERMNRWECRMERAISDKAPLQKLVDISSDIFRKPLFIFDYGLSVLAKSDKCCDSDEIVSTIFSNNGLPENYIHFLLDNNYFNEVKKCNKPDIFTIQLDKPYTLLLRSFSANLLTVDSIAMFFDNEQPSLADMDYLQLFTGFLERYIKTHYMTAEVPVVNIQSFYGDCLAGRIGTPVEIQKRASLLNLPFSGRFSVSYVHFEQFSYSSALYLSEEMRSSNPFATVFVYDQGVVVINDEQKFLNSEADAENIKSRSNDYLKKHNAKVGISGVCEDLANLKNAFIQAKASIELGMLLDPDKYRYRYRDYFFYHVIYMASKSVDINTLYAPRLKPLIQYDIEHHTNNLHLLEVYITSEYNVTATAKKMHLHRNSVIYRLERIKTLLGESLESPSFRANLLLSFHTLRLIDAMSSGSESVNNDMMLL